MYIQYALYLVLAGSFTVTIVFAVAPEVTDDRF